MWRRKQQDKLKRVRQLENHLEALKVQKNKLIRNMNAEPEYTADFKEAVDELKVEIERTAQEISAAKDIEQDLVKFTAFAMRQIHEGSFLGD